MPWLALALIALADPPLPTAPFEAPKYGVKAAIPRGGRSSPARRTTASSWP